MVIRVRRIVQCPNRVVITVESGTTFVADAAIITVPLGVLKANLIEFEPQLPDWKLSAISDLGVGNENKIALRFDRVFWPNVEVLGVVAPTSYACGYFLNLHKATGNPILVYMAAGSFAHDIEKLSDEEAVHFVMLHLKKMLPDATDPVRFCYLIFSIHTIHFKLMKCFPNMHCTLQITPILRIWIPFHAYFADLDHFPFSCLFCGFGSSPLCKRSGETVALIRAFCVGV